MVCVLKGEEPEAKAFLGLFMALRVYAPQSNFWNIPHFM